MRISLDTKQLLEERLVVDVQHRNTRTTNHSQPMTPDWRFNYAYHSSIGTFIVFRERSKVMKRSTLDDFAQATEGLWGLTLQIRISYRSWKKRISFSLFKERYGMKESLRCIWTHPLVLPPHSQIFQHTRNGDLRTIKSMFQLHRATPSDTTPDGVSLLHVSTAVCTSV